MELFSRIIFSKHVLGAILRVTQSTLLFLKLKPSSCLCWYGTWVNSCSNLLKWILKINLWNCIVTKIVNLCKSKKFGHFDGLWKCFKQYCKKFLVWNYENSIQELHADRFGFSNFHFYHFEVFADYFQVYVTVYLRNYHIYLR